MKDSINNNLVALSFDIEDWYHTPIITGSSFSIYKTVEEFHEKWNKDFDLITVPTLKLLKILDYFNIKATFFIVADIIDKYPLIVKNLKNSKHEIACHGLTHESAIDSKSKKPLKCIAEWIKNLSTAKSVLEKTFNKEIFGYRAPGAYFANWMIEPLENLGIKYDSSVAYNSIYNKTNKKLNNIPSHPYFLNKNDLSGNNPNSELVELPWSNLRLGKKFILPAGGAYFFRLLGYNYFSFVIKRNLRLGDTMFYLHPLDITNNKIPINNFRKRPFFWINKGYRTEKKLISLLIKYKGLFVPCIEVYNKFINDEKYEKCN